MIIMVTTPHQRGQRPLLLLFSFFFFLLLMMIHDSVIVTTTAAAAAAATAWAFHPTVSTSSSSSSLPFISVRHRRSLLTSSFSSSSTPSSVSSSFPSSPTKSSSSRLFCSSSSASTSAPASVAAVSTSTLSTTASSVTSSASDNDQKKKNNNNKIKNTVASSATTNGDNVNDASISSNILWKELCRRFQGDFDNYRQVIVDRAQGKLPRQGGGHEHIHCLLIPVNVNYHNNGESEGEEGRLAAFYFDGNPSAIFRFRYYQILPPPSSSPKRNSSASSSSSSSSIEMVLYTLHPTLEGQLRAISTRNNGALSWPHIFEDFVKEHGIKAAITELPNCNVKWSFDMDPIQHAYAVEKHNANMIQNKQEEVKNDTAVDMKNVAADSSAIASSTAAAASSSSNNADANCGIHAVMTCGEALVDSQMMPGQQILIRDQLSLWQDEFWIHDRGYNPITMEFIYGNQANIPYQLGKVSCITNVMDDSDKQQNQTQQTQLQRHVVDDDLAWTLGPDYRTPSEYQNKLNAVGGPSAKGAPAARLITNNNNGESASSQQQ